MREGRGMRYERGRGHKRKEREVVWTEEERERDHYQVEGILQYRKRRERERWKKTYIYIYIYAVELKICPRFALCWVENLSKVALKICPRFVFACFPPPPQFYSVFCWSKKTQIVCRGAKIFFGSLSGCLKRGFHRQKVHFWFWSFMLEQAKEKRWKQWKRTISKNAQKNSVFGWLWRTKVFFLKMASFRKIGKHYLCSEGKQKTHFRCNYLFWENGPFLWPFQVTKHYKNRGFSRHRGKPKMALLVAKVPFWEGASKGGFTICDT